MDKPKKPTNKNRIRPLDSKIFSDLYKANRPLPVKRIAKRINVSWPTVDKHVKKLQELKVLDVNKTIRRTNVSINQDFLNKMKKQKKGFFK